MIEKSVPTPGRPQPPKWLKILTFFVFPLIIVSLVILFWLS